MYTIALIHEYFVMCRSKSRYFPYSAYMLLDTLPPPYILLMIAVLQKNYTKVYLDQEVFVLTIAIYMLKLSDLYTHVHVLKIKCEHAQTLEISLYQVCYT